MGEPTLCQKIGLCKTVTPAGARTVSQTPNTVISELSASQIGELLKKYSSEEYPKINLNKYSRFTIEEPKKPGIALKDFILTLEGKEYKDDNGLTCKDTEYWGYKNSSLENGASKTTCNGNVGLTNLSVSKIQVGNAWSTLQVQKITETQSPELQKWLKKPKTQELIKQGIFKVNIPSSESHYFEELTVAGIGGDLNPTNEQEYKKVENRIPRFDQNGKSTYSRP